MADEVVSPPSGGGWSQYTRSFPPADDGGGDDGGCEVYFECDGEEDGLSGCVIMPGVMLGPSGVVDRAPPADLSPLPPLSEAPRCRRPPPAWTLTAARPLLPRPVRPPSLPPPLSAAAASRAIRPPVCCARGTQASFPARLSPFPDVPGPASAPPADSSAAASARDAPPPPSPGGSGCRWLYIFFREFALSRLRCWDFGLIPLAHVSLLQLPPRSLPEAPRRLCRPQPRQHRCRRP